jgi:Acyl-protein synthetase, LuxE
MTEPGERIDQLLAEPPYAIPPEQRQERLLELLKDELQDACGRNSAFRNYVRHWPVDPRSARRLADLPYLPVALLKSEPPLSLVDAREVKRVLRSSATSGQVPSKVVLDSPTARRMMRGVVAIVQDFIGAGRRPYLVVDAPESVTSGVEMGARGAAIQGLRPFATETTYCLRLDGAAGLTLDRDALLRFAGAHRGSTVLVYGFTYILWKHLVEPLIGAGLCLGLPDVHVLHSGGWKRMQDEAVSKQAFSSGVAQVFGCSPDRVTDFYGMVENVGVIYPDCPEGNKHAPAFGEVIVRDPLTLEPVCAGGQGIVQVCSVLPTSFPGYLLLTEDLGEIVGYDRCRCGRRGTSFRFAGRVPKAEIRGCGNIEPSKRLAGN